MKTSVKRIVTAAGVPERCRSPGTPRDNRCVPKHANVHIVDGHGVDAPIQGAEGFVEHLLSREDLAGGIGDRPVGCKHGLDGRPVALDPRARNLLLDIRKVFGVVHVHDLSLSQWLVVPATSL